MRCGQRRHAAHNNIWCKKPFMYVWQYRMWGLCLANDYSAEASSAGASAEAAGSEAASSGVTNCV